MAVGMKIAVFKHKKVLYIYSRNSDDPNTRAFCVKYCTIWNSHKRGHETL
jgi:hypothetical protein